MTERKIQPATISEQLSAERRWSTCRFGADETDMDRSVLEEVIIKFNEFGVGQVIKSAEAYPINEQGQVVIDGECVHDSK